MILHANLFNNLHLVRFEPGRIEFRPGDHAPSELAHDLSKFLNENTQRRWVVTVSGEAGEPTLRQRDEARAAAAKAKAAGATRFCMGAAWRGLKDSDLDGAREMARAVKALGMETCMTLGMLSQEQAEALKESGLDYYNHNIDTSPEYYGEIITTHDFQDRLETLNAARRAGLKICTGGIIGLGEGREDRAGMLEALANMDPHPESAPINMLTPIAGTPLADAPPLSPLEMVRMVAAARILMPRSHVRLSAGRAGMSAEAQALCFFAGANSIFYGEKLLTADNRDLDEDRELFSQLGLNTNLHN